MHVNDMWKIADEQIELSVFDSSQELRELCMHCMSEAINDPRHHAALREMFASDTPVLHGNGVSDDTVAIQAIIDGDLWVGWAQNKFGKP